MLRLLILSPGVDRLTAEVPSRTPDRYGFAAKSALTAAWANREVCPPTSIEPQSRVDGDVFGIMTCLRGNACRPAFERRSEMGDCLFMLTRPVLSCYRARARTPPTLSRAVEYDAGGSTKAVFR